MLNRIGRFSVRARDKVGNITLWSVPLCTAKMFDDRAAVASAAARFVVIVDSSKLVERLGEKTPIPVEIVQFGWLSTKQHLQDIGLESTVRQAESGRPYLTSNHNLILDCHAARGIDLARHETANAIKLQTGVVEHGLFLGMAAAVVVGLDDGAAEVRHPG